MRGDDLTLFVRTGVKQLLGLALLLLVSSGSGAQDIANAAFLVAQPALTAPTFARTVILVTQGRDGGALGVILNRPTDITPRDAFPKHKHLAALEQKVYFGGPVLPQGLLFLVRTSTPPPASVPVLRDVFLVSDIDWVDAALAERKLISDLRIFAGHSGWAPRQLRSEMERQGWYLLPADSATVFEHDVRQLWPELVKRAVLRPTRAVE